MYSDSEDIVYVVFTKGNPHWWTSFLNKDVAHCYIIKPDSGRWIVYGKAHKKMDLHTLSTISDILSRSIVIKAQAKGTKQSLFMINSCVGNTKQYLGINKPFLFTPYQLLKYLRINHGKQTKKA